VLRKIDSADGVLAIEVVGKLEAGDYRDVIVPALRSMIEAHDAIRCVFVFGDEYTGLTVGGDVQDAKLFFDELVHGQLSKWKRCAVVTSHDWLRHAITVFRFMMPGQVECFEVSQVQAAVDWAAA
jgi:SpoIIAA-like